MVAAIPPIAVLLVLAAQLGLRGRALPSPESFYRLRSAGVVSGETARDAQFRCPLYANHLGRHLL